MCLRMNKKFRVIYFYVSASFIWNSGKGDDPCSNTGIAILPGWIGKRNEICSSKYAENLQCDNFLDEQWYIIEKGVMINQCPTYGNCGSAYPAWMNGSYPSTTDGEVDLVACIVRDGECCKENVTMKVKNCTNYFVYYLKPLLQCTSYYCVESEFPCEAPTTTTTSTTTTTLKVPQTSASMFNRDNAKEEDSSNTILIVASSLGSAAFCLTVVGVVFCVHRSIKRRHRTVEPPPYEEVDRMKKPSTHEVQPFNK